MGYGMLVVQEVKCNFCFFFGRLTCVINIILYGLKCIVGPVGRHCERKL